MKSRGSVTGPLILILAGAVFLVRTLQPNFEIARQLAHYWPYLLILWGVVALLEVSIRFAMRAPVPSNGISGIGWFFVVLICIAGSIAFQVQRPDTWWHQAGFTEGMEVLGDSHQYSIEPIKRQTGPAPHIIIESFRGDAKIDGSSTNEVLLSGEKSIQTLNSRDADVTNTRTNVEVVNDGNNNIIVRCHPSRAGRSTVSFNLNLTVPKGSSIEATGTRGDFDISQVAGDVSINSSNAGVRLQDIGGRVKVETSRSDVIRCENIKGDVDLRGHGDDIELYKVMGQVTIDGDYHGSVSLRDLAKPVRVQNSRTTLEVQKIPGEVRLDRGSFSAQDVIGPITLNTHATDVSFDGFSSGLNLTVDRGDIELRPDRSPLGKIDVHSSSGNIELALPQAATFALNASTERGQIENEFGDSLKEIEAGSGARLQGTIGTGPDVDLNTSQGTITIRKASDDDIPKVHKKADKADTAEKDIAYLKP